MIVKNEVALLDRLLASVSAFVSNYVICDTGSSDGTMAHIAHSFASLGIPGELHSIPFEGFGAARNLALQLARASELPFDYLLLADADMELVVDEADFAQRLSAPAYLLGQKSSGVSYTNVRLLRRDVDAHYVGSTHEYLSVEGSVHLQGAWFLDYADGFNRTDKLERDTGLLLAELEHDPDNARAVFYLAQTCRDAGNLKAAVSWYGLRTTMSGYAEETWYARYQMALSYQRLWDFRKFIAEALQAYSERPWRVEPLYALARYYRSQRMLPAALLFAERAREIPYPGQDLLFVEDDVYATGVAEELSHALIHEEDKTTGRDLCFWLSTHPGLGPERAAEVIDDLRHYALPASQLFGELEWRELCWPNVERPFNPSVARHEDQLYCIVRTANYRIVEGRYCMADPDSVIRTTNYFIRPGEPPRLIQAPPGPYGGPVHGMEDCRLFRLRDRWWCTATVRDHHPGSLCEIALAALDDEGQVQSLRVLDSPWPGAHEKNWVPLIRDDQLYLLWRTGPTRVFLCDPETGTLVEAALDFPALNLDGLRGSSQAIAVAGGWLYLARHAIDGPRAYFHRFVLLDEHFRVSSLSHPFYFRKVGIEFCAGLAHDPESKKIVASIGIDDQEAHLVFLSLAAVLASLQVGK